MSYTVYVHNGVERVNEHEQLDGDVELDSAIRGNIF